MLPGNPEEHPHVAADVEDPSPALVSLDLPQLLAIVGIAMVRSYPLEDQPRLRQVEVFLAPVDFLRRHCAGGRVDEAARSTATDPQLALLGTQRARLILGA
jgi:hypothetical protein